MLLGHGSKGAAFLSQLYYAGIVSHRETLVWLGDVPQAPSFDSSLSSSSASGTASFGRRARGVAVRHNGGAAESVGGYDFSSMISDPSRSLIRRLIAARRSFCW
jgi:hypothetical protein